MSNDNQEVNLMQVQWELEKVMKDGGESKYHIAVSKAKKRGAEETTKYGQEFAQHYVNGLAKAYSDFQEEAKSGKAGKRHSTIKYLGDTLTPKQVAFIALKNVLATISNPRSFNDLAIQIGMALEDEIRLLGIRAQEKRVYDSIIRGSLKRGAQHYKHFYALRRAGYFEDGWVSWGNRVRLLIGVKLLHLIVNNLELISIDTVHRGGKSKKVVTPVAATLAKIIEYGLDGFKPVLEPMVVYPNRWESPFGGGYITSHITPIAVVKKVPRKRVNKLYGKAEMPKVYQTLNALQNTAWNINQSVLGVMQTLWDSESELAGVPLRYDEPLPTKPHDIDTNEESREIYKRDTAKAYVKRVEARSHRVSFFMSLEMATKFSVYKRIFMPYQLDFRGRIYAVPFLNPQGPDFQKALLRFSEGKPLGSEGIKWLLIHGANVAGVDKVSFQERIDWVENNEEEILAIAADPLQHTGWAKSVGGVDIDKPWQFLAFCFEYAGYCEKGEKFVSHLPIALDGSCSGLQHFSAMLRDTEGGKAVNLLPQDKPADVYQLVADEVIIQVKKDAENGTEDELLDADGRLSPGTKSMANEWLTFGITRKTTKRSVMTLAYGSKMYGFKDQIMEDTLRPAKKQMGDSFPFYGDGYPAATYMARKIWEAVQVKITAAPKAMAWLQEVVKVANRDGSGIIWTTPAGFTVEQRYPQMKEREIETSLNGRIRLKISEATEKVDARQQTQSIAPNFVHSMDSSHLMLTVCRVNDSGIKSFAMIHDSFGTHAADTDELFATVRDTFVEMYQDNDVLKQFKEQVAYGLTDSDLVGVLPAPLPIGNLNLEEVKDSMYCFA